jgi:hypothetical protein
MPPNQVQHSAGRKKSDLVNIRSLSAREPATSTGKVMWIWPEIEESLATGKKLREVWEAVHADGLAIPYPQFRVYVSRLRSRTLRQRPAESSIKPHAAVDDTAESQHESQVPADPYQNLHDQRKKKQLDGFTFDPFPNNNHLIK